MDYQVSWNHEEPSMSTLDQLRYTYTDADFNFIKKLISEHSGININESKRELVYGRLSKRIRQLGLGSFREYCNLLKSGDEEELYNCIDAITTNVTHFFRENHHFEFLFDNIIPSILNNPVRSGLRKLRVWSAGCSTGEEPYSIEIILRKFVQLNAWDVKILATDLSYNVLHQAQQGIYRRSEVEGVSEDTLKKWFLQNRKDRSVVRVNDELKKRIFFKRLNLNSTWEITGPIDVIFCRNVVIYFNKETQRRLFDRFANILSDDGYLILGHSESMFGVSDRFELVSRTIYKKKI